MALFGFTLARRFGLAVLITEYGFARELDLVALTTDALHQNLLSLLQLVAHVFHAAVGDFGDVKQPVSAGNAPKSTMRETVPRYV